MGCCGDKRRTWLAEEKVTKNQHKRLKGDQDSRMTVDKVIFEYTGEVQFSIRGVVTRRFYYFKKGDKLEVSYEDSFALMGERDLKRK